jgi:hypothetical protein
LWVGGEVLGALTFSLYTTGPGSYLTAGFSFGQSGYALAQHELLLGVAVWGSVYALSLCVYIGAYSVYLLRQQYHYVVLLVGLILLTSVVSPPWLTNHTTETPTVALIATDITPDSLFYPTAAT